MAGLEGFTDADVRTTLVRTLRLLAVLTVAANDLSVPQGNTLPKLTVTYVGFVKGDTASSLTGSPVLTTNAKSTSPEGIYTISVKQGTLAAKNYTFILQGGELLIIPPKTTFRGPWALVPSRGGNPDRTTSNLWESELVLRGG